MLMCPLARSTTGVDGGDDEGGVVAADVDRPIGDTDAVAEPGTGCTGVVRRCRRRCCRRRSWWPRVLTRRQRGVEEPCTGRRGVITQRDGGVADATERSRCGTGTRWRHGRMLPNVLVHPPPLPRPQNDAHAACAGDAASRPANAAETAAPSVTVATLRTFKVHPYCGSWTTNCSPSGSLAAIGEQEMGGPSPLVRATQPVMGVEPPR